MAAGRAALEDAMGWVRRIMLGVGVLLVIAIAAAFHAAAPRAGGALGHDRGVPVDGVHDPRQFQAVQPVVTLVRAGSRGEVHLRGPRGGCWAKLTWAGNPQTLGSGYQAITASTPYGRIEADVDFGQGGTPAKQVYALAADGAGTKLTWSMDVDLG